MIVKHIPYSLSHERHLHLLPVQLLKHLLGQGPDAQPRLLTQFVLYNISDKSFYFFVRSYWYEINVLLKNGNLRLLDV